ncbi:uncharacterized protein LOC144134963 [Amblyomma americanum]
MNASGEPGMASSLASLDLDAVDGSCDSIAFDSTTKLNSSRTGARRDVRGGDALDADRHSVEGDGASASWRRSRSRFTPWSRVHQRMLGAVFLVGVLFAVAVGAAYLLDGDHSDEPRFRGPFEMGAPAPNGTANATVSGL